MIYFVEDDASIRELVLYTLNNAGFQAEGFERPSAFWKADRKSTRLNSSHGKLSRMPSSA